MKIACISDLHGELPAIPPCDLLLIAGDVCPITNHDTAYQANWLNTTFADWIKQTPVKHRVVVAGNHDFVWGLLPALVEPSPHYHYLQDRAVELDGVKVWGAPWQPYFWGVFGLTESELERKWSLIPDDVDIWVVHGPPKGYGDLTSRGESVGSRSLTDAIAKRKPKLVVVGHIHEAYGDYQLGDTLILNVAHNDESHTELRGPIQIKLENLPTTPAPSLT